jgi:UDP-glucose 4-epimerase
MTSIVVSGANGFLGRHVSRIAAASGARVTGVGRGMWTPAAAAAWGVSDWCETEVTTESLRSSVGSPDIFLHCAGSGSAALAQEDPGKDFARTVGLTVEVLEYIRSHSPQTVLVYPSTGAVYGSPARFPVSEADPAAPISPYGVHKRMAEDMIASYARHFAVRAAIVRIFSLYGAELRKQLLWDACQKATRGVFTFAGTGSETRDWVAVEDAASLLLLAASQAGAEAPVVNCATGIETSMRDVLGELFSALGVDEQPRFTGERRPGDLLRYAGDPTQAFTWGWEPRRQWREGVRDYSRWFLTLGLESS